MRLMQTVVGLLIQPAIFVRIVSISWKAILWPDLMLLLTLRQLPILCQLPILRQLPILCQLPILRQYLTLGLPSSNQKIGEYNI